MRGLNKYREAEVVTSEPKYSDAHLKVVTFIDELITTMMSQNSALSPVVKMMHRARPAILRDLAQIPEDELQKFMVDLGSRMVAAGTPDTIWPEPQGPDPDCCCVRHSMDSNNPGTCWSCPIHSQTEHGCMVDERQLEAWEGCEDGSREDQSETT